MRFLFVITFIVFFSAVSLSQEKINSGLPPLDLKTALINVYETNPSIKAARAKYLSVTENVALALSNHRPSLSATADITALRSEIEGQGFITGDIDNVSKTYGLNVEQSLFRGGRNFTEVKAARLLVQAERQNLLAKEQEVFLDAGIAYLDYLLAKSLVDLNVGNKELLDKQLEASEARYEVGELTKTDVSLSLARLADAEADLVKSKGQLRTARSKFIQIIGIDPEGVDQFDAIFLNIPESLIDALNVAETTNPNILSAQFAQQAAKQDTQSIFGELLPEIALSGQYEKAEDPGIGALSESETTSVGINATLPLYQGGNTRARIRQSKYVEEERLQFIREQMLSTKQSVTGAWEEWQASIAEIESRSAQVDANEIVREGTYEEALLGQRTVLDSLDADQELLIAKTDLVTAKRNESVALMTLLKEIGSLNLSNISDDIDEKDYTKLMKEAGKSLFSTKIKAE